MRLVLVKILGNNFRSLAANQAYSFNTVDREHLAFQNARLSVKCFAGLNGSGKSNMLELISEIFYFLDYAQLVSGDANQKLGKGFGFEIEYELPLSEVDREMLYGEPLKDSEWVYVKITKSIDRAPEYSLSPVIGKKRYRTVDQEQHLLLPKNIVAYTSGQNELLSNPFYKLKYHYFKEIIQLGGHQETSDRMFFIDNTNNYNVFLANILLGEKKKLDIIKKAYKITGLESFRITINKQDYNKKNIPFLKGTTEVIEKLKACATCWDEQNVFEVKGRKQYVLDFLVNDETIKAFKFHFENSTMKLFKALYKLEMLNQFMQKRKIHNLVTKGPKWLNISDEIPSIDVNDRIYRLEKIMINKLVEGGTKPINYKNLSDGEHQFNEVVGSMMLMDSPGCLLMYDEPDTHFNPKWRSSIMRLFNQMAAVGYNDKGKVTKVLDQEVIITTHSPFAISDTYKEDVYIFDKRESAVNITNPKIPTYGASVSVILEHVFMKDYTIASIAHSELNEIKEMATSLAKIQEARSLLNNYGESIEKFNAIRYLRAREKEIRKTQEEE